jgi:hypothetical protein
MSKLINIADSIAVLPNTLLNRVHKSCSVEGSSL